MHPVVWLIAIPAATAALIAVAAALVWRKDPSRRNAVWRRLPLAAALNILLFTLLHTAAVLFFSSDNSPLPLLAVGAASLCITPAIALPKTDPLCSRRPALCRFVRQLGVIAAVLMVTELCICNFQSFSPSYDQTVIPAATATLENGAIQNGDHLELKSGSSAVFTQSCDGVRSVGVLFYPTEQPFRLTISAKDDNFSNQSQPLFSRIIPSDSGAAFLPINTYGVLRDLKITVADADAPVMLYSVVVSNALPLDFSAMRYLGLLVLAGGIAAIVTGRLYLCVYDRRRASHRVAVAMCLVLALMPVMAMFLPYLTAEPEEINDSGDTVATIAYPFKSEHADSRDPYVQQFDAFMKGQLHLDILPHETLTALENPYDYSLRNGVYYQWDRAYYNGQYYSYFGVAPVLTFYYPFYWLTGALPQTAVACGFFSVLATLFLFALLMRLVNTFCKRVNLLLLCVGTLAVTAASGLWWQLIQANDYTVVLCAGLCFLFFTLWAGVRAYITKNRLLQPLLFALCGVGVVLTVASRPTLVLSALILAPLFLHVLIRRDYSVKRKICSALAFLIPLGAGATAIMLFNHARFGSPFEFGATYQLTVSNIAANTMTFSLLPSAIYHYFLQPLTVSNSFPFIRPMYSVMQGYGRYMYIDTMIGALSIPLVTAGMAGLPAVAKSEKKARSVWFWVLILAPVLALVAAFCDFCMGGTNIRYTTDVLPLLCIVALPILLTLHYRLNGFIPRRHQGKLTAVAAAILAVTIVIGVCVTLHLSSSSSIVDTFYPQLLPKLEDLLLFWQ